MTPEQTLALQQRSRTSAARKASLIYIQGGGKGGSGGSVDPPKIILGGSLTPQIKKMREMPLLLPKN